MTPLYILIIISTVTGNAHHIEFRDKDACEYAADTFTKSNAKVDAVCFANKWDKLQPYAFYKDHGVNNAR